MKIQILLLDLTQTLLVPMADTLKAYMHRNKIDYDIQAVSNTQNKANIIQIFSIIVLFTTECLYWYFCPHWSL